MIGEEAFATHVSSVNNIVEVPRITTIPQSPEYMMGVINLRGQVLPVVDMRVRIGLSAAEISTNTCILVLELESEDGIQQVGGLVDSVKEVLEIDQDEIMAAPRVGKKAQQDFISGIANRDDEFVMILDVYRLLSGSDLDGFVEQVKKIKEKIEVNNIKGE
jgi:purine-binding chemotaxis protein CheW